MKNENNIIIYLARPKCGAPDCNNNDNGKRKLLFLGSEAQKMISCERVIVQCVVLLLFQLIETSYTQLAYPRL